jgi:hypothetical protein
VPVLFACHSPVPNPRRVTFRQTLSKNVCEGSDGRTTPDPLGLENNVYNSNTQLSPFLPGSVLHGTKIYDHLVTNTHFCHNSNMPEPLAAFHTQFSKLAGSASMWHAMQASCDRQANRTSAPTQPTTRSSHPLLDHPSDLGGIP